jgi:glycosyltransferase involved in cell wall biosynthesis
MVTPSFQQGHFLERTLRSVLQQGYPLLEYVVMDGGSTDGSIDIMQRYGSSLARWVSAPDGGQAAAINEGFRDTTGSIMAWLNSDDLLLPGSLAFVGRYFASHREIDAIYGHSLVIDEEDRQIGFWTLPRHDGATLRWMNIVPQETLFWRREIWERVGGLDPSFEFNIDWEMLTRMQDAGARFARVPRFLGAFRLQPDQKHQHMMAVGRAEAAVVRRRIHGPFTDDDASRAVWPFFIRQAVRDRAYRTLTKWPRQQVALTEPGLQPPDDR